MRARRLDMPGPPTGRVIRLTRAVDERSARTPAFARSAGALRPWRELRLGGPVTASLVAHAVLIGLVLAAGRVRSEKRIDTDGAVRVSLNLGPIPGWRSKDASGPRAAPAASRMSGDEGLPREPRTPAPPAPPKPQVARETAPALRQAQRERVQAPPPAKAPRPKQQVARNAAPAPAPKPSAQPKASPALRQAQRERDTEQPADTESALERALKRVGRVPSGGGDDLTSSPQHPLAAASTRGAGQSTTSSGGVGTGAGEGTSGAATDDLVRAYAERIRHAVEGACQIPSGIPRDQASDAIVQLRVDATGHVLSFALSRSSGFAALDEALRSVFARIALPAPPTAIASRAQRGGLRIVFPFSSGARA